MKQKKSQVGLLLILSCLMLYGCSQDTLPGDVDSGKYSQISNLIGDCYRSIHSNTRAEANSYRILDVFTQTYKVPDSLRMQTRSESLPDTYDIHTVTVDFGESTGFAIVSDTPGIDHIFYYTETGCISDTTLIPPMKDMVESFPEIAANLLVYGQDEEKSTRSVSKDIGPICPFSWDQGVPFNNRGAYCECDNCRKIGNHNPIGCVAIAVGQAIATMGNFKSTFYGIRDIDCDDFPIRSNFYTDHQAVIVSIFLQEIALGCQMKFGCDSSLTTLYAATNYMRDMGYKVDNLDGELDKTRYISCLENGLPHVMSGIKGKEGHAWILDGIKTVNGTDKYHINWGAKQGSSNGWSTEYYYRSDGKINYPKNHRHMYFGGVRTK